MSTTISRKSLGAFAAIFASALFVVLAWAPFFRPPPVRVENGRCIGCNVILISADSMRVDRMSVYGYKRDTTPAIQEWAQSAVVFENYFSAAVLTPISEAAVHTGLYPEVNGMVSFRHEISPEVKTMATLFKQAGYNTAATGTSPEFWTYEALKKSFSKDFDEYQFSHGRLDFARTPDWPTIKNTLQSRQRPFFLWIPLGDAHSPFGAMAKNHYADENYGGPFADLLFFTNMQFYYDGWFYNPLDPGKQFEVLIYGAPNREMHTPTKDSFPARNWPVKATEADYKFLNDMYDNGVREVDREVGRLLRQIDSMGIGDRTVVILQTEHGEGLGEHKYIAHYDILDTQVHTPLIISSPAIKAGRSDILVSGVDILPTVLDHVGIPSPPDLDGKPIFNKLGEVGPGREEVYMTRSPLWESLIKAKGDNARFDRFRALDDRIGFKDHGIRTKTAKLIHRTARLVEEQFSCWTFVSGKKVPRLEYEFYDLVRDPMETRPLPPMGEQAKIMMTKLKDWKTDVASRARSTTLNPSVQDYR